VVGGIYPVYLKIENPVIYGGGFHKEGGKEVWGQWEPEVTVPDDGFEEMMDDRDKFVEYISGAKGERGYWRKRYIAENSAEANKAFVQYLKSRGHDGIIIVNTKGH